MKLGSKAVKELVLLISSEIAYKMGNTELLVWEGRKWQWVFHSLRKCIGFWTSVGENESLSLLHLFFAWSLMKMRADMFCDVTSPRQRQTLTYLVNLDFI